MSLDDAVKKLRGDPGTKMRITILRESEDLIQDFTITREISMCRISRPLISWMTISAMSV